LLLVHPFDLTHLNIVYFFGTLSALFLRMGIICADFAGIMTLVLADAGFLSCSATGAEGGSQ